MEKILKRFSPEVARVLEDALSLGDGMLTVRRGGADLFLDNLCESCFSYVLTLHDASGMPKEVRDGWYLNPQELEETEDGYLLRGWAEDEECGNDLEVELQFRDLSVKLWAHRCEEIRLETKAWSQLSGMASGIVRKSILAPQLVNDREQELLPLLGEIAMLYRWGHRPVDGDWPIFPHLKEKIQQFGYSELIPALEKLAHTGESWKKFWKQTDRLLAKLNRQKYESLWREIYGAIRESQRDYPLKSVSERMEAERTRIEALFHVQGYSGSYPNFVKQGQVKGLRILEAHGQPYFVWNEKRAVFHIRCVEQTGTNYDSISFLCGTELLKKGEHPGDIFSCMFNAKGRRALQTVQHWCTDAEARALKCGIAVKRAELKRLTREEQKCNGNGFSWWAFWGIFLLAGGFFATFWTLSMLAVTVLGTGVFAGWEKVPLILEPKIWWQAFAFCWIGFGGAMGLLTVWINRH